VTRVALDIEGKREREETVNRIVVRLALPLETRDPAMLAKVVDALDKDPLFRPG
jgi:hypothetical protein